MGLVQGSGVTPNKSGNWPTNKRIDWNGYQNPEYGLIQSLISAIMI